MGDSQIMGLFLNELQKEPENLPLLKKRKKKT